MDLQPRKSGFKFSARLIYGAGLLLFAYMTLLLVTTYTSQQQLRQAFTLEQQLDMEKQVSNLAYFFSERKSDLVTLSDNSLIANYFSNRDLGMSMQYGLRSSLLNMQRLFSDLLANKTIDTKPIYLRLSLINTQNKKLVDLGKLKDSWEPWNEYDLTQINVLTYAILQGQDHTHILYVLPYLDRGIRKGTIVAELNAKLITNNLLHTDDQNHTYQILLDEHNPHVKVIRRQHEIDSAIKASLPHYSLDEDTGLPSILKMAIKDTPFLLIAASNKKHGIITSPYYMVALVGLAVLILFIIWLGIRTHNKNLILRTQFQESQKQHEQLHEQNQRLEQEMHRRRKSEAQLKTFIDTIPDIAWIIDTDGIYITGNKKLADFLGISSEHITGKSIYESLEYQQAKQIQQRNLDTIKAGMPSVSEEKVTFNIDGHEELQEVIRTPIYDGQQRLIGILGIGRDITHRKQTEEHLRTLSQAIEQNPVAILITDTQGHIEYVNKSFERITGYSSQEVLGCNPRILKSETTSKEIHQELWKHLSSGESWEHEIENKRKDGSVINMRIHVAPVFDSQGRILHYLGMQEDISLQKRQEAQILHQAHFDNLTDLPNRFLSLDRLSQLIKESNRDNNRTAILFIDLDDFKKINDTLGHATGDKMLIQAAQRLTDAVRSQDTVGRLGGDEFIVLLGNILKTESVRAIANQLLECFRCPFLIDGRELTLTASIGIAFYPDDGSNSGELLRRADTAMYQSKAQGRNNFHFYAESMNQGIERRLEVEQQMRGALNRNEFQLFYQPLINLKNNQIIGAEGLIRWTNNALGAVNPDEFIPIAEQSGLIHDIGNFVLEQAMNKIPLWQKEFFEEFHLAINVSPQQFRDNRFINRLKQLIQAGKVNPSGLQLEITEGVLLGAQANIQGMLRALNDFGIRLSMDDFGTGYSSMSYLRSYPFSTLKVDRSFVNDITSNHADFELVNASIWMAHGLGLKVVAEGVETNAQLEILRSLGCDYAQGYYFGKPDTSEVMEQLLKEQPYLTLN